MIFVIIYAYRDMELDKTIKDCFAKADKPEEVAIGCINADDTPYIYDGEYDVRVINDGWEHRHGCGFGVWEITKKLYKGEEWVLRAAPHSRFKKGWDAHYLKYAEKDTVLCSRCLEYLPDGTLTPDEGIYSKPVKFSKEIVVALQKCPMPSRKNFEVNFMQAGGMFCHKTWMKDVGYDPYVAMWGEETDLSMRTYCSGYKMIHLGEPQVYHLWHRRNRKGIDASYSFVTANAIGVERVKMKLGLRKLNNENVSISWDRYGFDGHEYKELLEKEFNKGA